MKPSDKLRAFFDANQKRYANQGIDERNIATLLNLVLSDAGVAGQLDRLDAMIRARD